MGTAIKHPVPDQVKLSHPGTLTLSPDVRMSKITHDSLTRSDTGCFIAVPILLDSLHPCSTSTSWQQWASIG